MQSDTKNISSDSPHILVIDDDVKISELVGRYLREHGFVVVRADSAAQARVLMENMIFDALVVDVMMPGETGVEFTKSLAQMGNRPPVLLLTALGEIENRLEGLEAGADDYLAKPFEPKELVLRLQAILRRTKKKKTSSCFKIGAWVFDTDKRALNDGTNNQSLTDMEMNLLLALASADGQVLSREDLAKACELDAGERTIDVQVTRLRKKIEEDTKNPRYLQTVRGKGYLLRIEAL